MQLSEKQISEMVRKVLSQMAMPKSDTHDGTVPVGVSNRHVHLSEGDLEILFGKGYKLTPIKELSQPGP